VLEEEMKRANEEYEKAIYRASEWFLALHFAQAVNKINSPGGIVKEDLHSQMSQVLKLMLSETDADLIC